jgi:hypothetical protein
VRTGCISLSSTPAAGGRSAEEPYPQPCRAVLPRVRPRDDKAAGKTQGLTGEGEIEVRLRDCPSHLSGAGGIAEGSRLTVQFCHEAIIKRGP